MAGEPSSLPEVLTSELLNFLVFRYLQESGFTHAAFTLGYEAQISRSQIDSNSLSPGALVKFVQKGLQYTEMEANIIINDEDDYNDFFFLQPMDLVTKDVRQLQQIIKEKKEKQYKEQKGKDREGHQDAYDREREKHARDRERARDKAKIKKDKEMVKDQDDMSKTKLDESVIAGGLECMDIVPSSYTAACVVHSSNVTVLEGHSSEVLVCAWSPTGSLLASGSGDGTARIWNIPDGPCGFSMHIEPSSVHVLKHFKGRTGERREEVTTLDWNHEGTLLATGALDGLARIWSKDGELKNTLVRHKRAILSLRWTKNGEYMLCGSADRTASVWDVKTWECKQQFEFHSAEIIDADWRNSNSFATCSVDSMIYVCKIGESRPVKAFGGHKGEVNSVRWDPTGSILASCSDDGTAKIWSLKQDKYVHSFRHSKGIYTIRWSPTGPGSDNPNKQLLLASASIDSTIKLWDVDRGSLIKSLAGHRKPVYSVAFSPNGEYLASGSQDQQLNIWSVKDGKIVKTYSGGSDTFEVHWNKEGDKIAASHKNNTVCIMDFRM